jgi:hypothetical protein
VQGVSGSTVVALVLAAIQARMSEFVTVIAKCNEVFFRVIARVTAELIVVNLKVLH